MFAKGVASFVLGFAAWNADNLWCDTLESWRERLPFFIGALLQFHSWWHAVGLSLFSHSRSTRLGFLFSTSAQRTTSTRRNWS